MKKTLLPFLLFFMSILVFSQSEAPLATNATAGKLTVRYALPAPIDEIHYCIYITNSSNLLVNTLSYRYGTLRGGVLTPIGYANQMTTYWSLIGSTFNTTNFKFVGAPDGVSGATVTTGLSSPIPLATVYWGQSTAMAAAVATLADGPYKVNFESVKNNNNRSYASATFVKGPATSTPTVSPAITTFNSISISWVPASTAVKSVELEKLYSVSPNPVKTSFMVKGADILSVELFTLAGKKIKSTSETKMNISSLAKGNYMAVVTTKSGKFSKKIVKQ